MFELTLPYCMRMLVSASTNVLYDYIFVSIFEAEMPPSETLSLVTYNVMLDVYRKMGRSWHKILCLLEDMKSNGLVFDDLSCSMVIAACGEQGCLRRQLNSIVSSSLKATPQGQLRIMLYSKSSGRLVFILKRIERNGRNNCPQDSVTYNELLGAYLRAGFYEEGAALIGIL